MRPEFKDIQYKAQQCCNKKAEAPAAPLYHTSEQIDVKPVYTKEDLEGMEHLNYAAGVAPFLRGPYSTMYVQRPWTIR
ncbi:MAG: methylmalonyl-CoA mutase, partial [Bacteroidales bacterium]|nr:methylmalonyl-CoA mutase [Bacteroidales bacterium]